MKKIFLIVAGAIVALDIALYYRDGWLGLFPKRFYDALPRRTFTAQPEPVGRPSNAGLHTTDGLPPGAKNFAP